MKSENPKGVESALECLRLFGIEMPAHPTREQVDAEYEKVWNNLGERPIESLIDLPLMTDPEMRAAMGVLSVLSSPAYFTDIKLFRLHLCHMVNVSMKYGTTDASAQAYCPVRNDARLDLPPLYRRLPLWKARLRPRREARFPGLQGENLLLDGDGRPLDTADRDRP